MLAGKRGVVLGVANKRSLAYGIAEACVAHGARIAITYQNERFESAARTLAPKITGGHPVDVLQCNVRCDEDMDRLAADLKELYGGIDFVVHSVAYAKKSEMRGCFRDTSRPGFEEAMDISAYSLIPLARRMAGIMNDDGAILALSYMGAERVVPNYNVMGVAKAALEASVRYLAWDLGPHGIRVNALSPGPIKTVSAAAIGDFARMLQHHRNVAPLGRNVTAKEIGDTAAFYVSDMASAITGSVLHLDCGFSIMGVPAAEFQPPPARDEG